LIRDTLPSNYSSSFTLCREDKRKAVSVVGDTAYKGCQKDTHVVVILLLVEYFAGVEQCGRCSGGLKGVGVAVGVVRITFRYGA
jgi:NADH:ubiquinone oxidoreductase subunit F (NADH-binding)